MRSRGVRARGAYFVLLLFAVSVIVFVPSPAASLSRAANHPIVEDDANNIDYDELNSGSARLSGLRDNAVTVTYTTAPPETQPCVSGSQIRYTINSTAPPQSTHTAALTCTPPAGPGDLQTRTYEGTIPASVLSTAGPNALVRFQFEIQVGNAMVTDSNGGQFFSYRLDVSRASVVERSPGPVAGSTVKVGVTREQ